MHALIVGCGYVGLSLGAELVRQGHEVSGMRRTIVAEPDLRAAGITPLAGDITRRETLDSLPTGFDWVVHCVSASGGAAEEYRGTYLEGTGHLVEWLAPRPPRKFIYTSSTSVYGQTDGSIVTETSPTEPAAETGQLLVLAEQVLLEAARQHRLPAVILRVAGIYGPCRGYWFRQFLQGTAQIEGQGEGILNMIHRDDVVGAVIAGLQRGEPGEVYNAVDEEPVSQLALFQWLAKKLGRELPPVAPAAADTFRKRGLTSKRVSNRKLKLELGYQFKYPTFREGWDGCEQDQPHGRSA
jgi:nucleoside-diphosphate-sugar epimerase